MPVSRRSLLTFVCSCRWVRAGAPGLETYCLSNASSGAAPVTAVAAYAAVIQATVFHAPGVHTPARVAQAEPLSRRLLPPNPGPMEGFEPPPPRERGGDQFVRF